MVSYVYHMFKEHWCGDDFEFSNDLWARTYSTPKTPEVPRNFFQPQPDEWYTVWSHVQMNSAGVLRCHMPVLVNTSSSDLLS